MISLSTILLRPLDNVANKLFGAVCPPVYVPITSTDTVWVKSTIDIRVRLDIPRYNFERYFAEWCCHRFRRLEPVSEVKSPYIRPLPIVPGQLAAGEPNPVLAVEEPALGT